MTCNNQNEEEHSEYDMIADSEHKNLPEMTSVYDEIMNPQDTSEKTDPTAKISPSQSLPAD